MPEPSSPKTSPVVDTSPVLHREVLPPLRSHGGVGVMLVASAAMFFAVAGSAFALRASAADCPYRNAEGTQARETAVERAPAPADCGPVYHRTVDGDTQVFFQVCTDEAPVVLVKGDIEL